MTRSLVVAPQWIGDAVMSEPLLAALQARGEQLAVAALPWVAPVYLAMPQVAEVIELPFAHGRLDWAARRRIAVGLTEHLPPGRKTPGERVADVKGRPRCEPAVRPPRLAQTPDFTAKEHLNDNHLRKARTHLPRVRVRAR